MAPCRCGGCGNSLLGLCLLTMTWHPAGMASGCLYFRRKGRKR